MADEFYSLVTDIGAIKQLESVRDGVPFDVYEIALGDSNGTYYTPQTDQTALRNEVWRGLIEKCEWVDNKFYCVTTVPASVGGFTVREAISFITQVVVLGDWEVLILMPLAVQEFMVHLLPFNPRHKLFISVSNISRQKWK